MNWGKVGLFAGGVLFGTAGIKTLTSRDAKGRSTLSRPRRRCAPRKPS